jgi:hypothetical protein
MLGRRSCRSSLGRTSVRTAKAIRLTLLLATAALASRCGGSSSPTGPGCVNVQGVYDGTFTMICAGSTSGSSFSTQVPINQTGCEISGRTLFNIFSLSGTVSGHRVSFTAYHSDLPCASTAPGIAEIDASGTVNGSEITGSYTGTIDSSSCCSRFGGSFTLTRP